MALERREKNMLRQKKIRANQKKPKAVIQAQKRKWRIVEGDEVIVINGLDKDKSGKVLKVLKDQDAVLVENVNIRKQEKLDEMTLNTVEVHEPFPISYSAVSLIDPETGRPTKVHRGWLEDGTKVRRAVRSQAIIPYPPRDPPDTREFEGDTPPDSVLKRTYVESAPPTL